MPGHLKMMGGDASTYGTRVYGAAGNQHAAPGGNVIAMNVGGGKMPDLSPTTVGGRRSRGRRTRGRRSRGRRGGNILSDIALPATLMYANHAYGKGKNGSSNTFYNRKKSRKNRSRSSRRTYRR